MSDNKLEIYKTCLKKLSLNNNYNMYDLYEIYRENTGLKDNITNIKFYFYRNVFISIKEYKSGYYDNFTVDINEFKEYMRDFPEKIKKKEKARSNIEYKILLRKLS